MLGILDLFLNELLFLKFSVLRGSQHHTFPLLQLHLTPPESVLVKVSEGVDHDWYGKSKYEDPREGTQAANKFTKKCPEF